MWHNKHKKPQFRPKSHLIEPTEFTTFRMLVSEFCSQEPVFSHQALTSYVRLLQIRLLNFRQIRKNVQKVLRDPICERTLTIF